jgi:hypothetical protein
MEMTPLVGDATCTGCPVSGPITVAEVTHA